MIAVLIAASPFFRVIQDFLPSRILSLVVHAKNTEHWLEILR
jgi:hypothetical protein